ncbi:MAG: NnrU family protein [Hyphomonadaceae bacterium]|nr:NnrU family protein [Hyphomonadaceae bacterium]
MSSFVWALAAFVLLHLGASVAGLRDRLVALVGVGAYRIGFSLATIALMVWMIHSFGAARGDPFDPINEMLWAPPDWGRWAAYILTAFGFVLIASGLITPNVTRVGGEKGLAAGLEARGIVRVTRHPFLWGVALWAAAHLLVNGERFAPMLFGALGVMALLGTRSIDRKTAKLNPEGWEKFAAQTSNMPFAAIAQGRNQLALNELVPGVAAGLVLFAIIGFFHAAFTGAPAF